MSSFLPKIIVVGAGPAGLATGYYLQQAGFPFLLLERGDVGNAWAHHYDSLALHTPRDFSSLPGLPMPRDYPTFPDKDQFLAYLQAYARHFDLPVVAGVDATRVEDQRGRWQLDTSHGLYESELLVLATGIWSKPYCPRFPGDENFPGRMLHARDYRRPDPFFGRRVLVVGVGNSGAEIAVELADAGVEVGISVRSGAVFGSEVESTTALRLAAWLARVAPNPLVDAALRRRRPDFSEIGLPLPDVPPHEAFPVVGFELPEAVRAGRVTTYRGIRLVDAQQVHFDDGRSAPFDTIILATGFRPAVDFAADYLELEDGQPRLDGYRSVRHQRLYAVGYAYPGTDGWLHHIDRVSRLAVQQIRHEWHH